MRMLRVCLGTALLLTTGGCGILEPDAWEERSDALERSRARWERAGPDAYRYELSRSCECLPSGRMLVRVEQGAVTDLTYLPSGEAAAVEYRDYVETVEDLFTRIEMAIEQRAHMLEVEYHATLGYPTLINYDGDVQLADDEIVLRASGLEPLPEASAAQDWQSGQ